MEDRRENRRLRMVSHLEVMFKDDGNRINAFTTNVSKNGLGFCTGKQVEAGRDVELKIYFDQSPEQQIAETVSARSQWVKQISRMYEAGGQVPGAGFQKYP